MVVSLLGYEPYHQRVMITNKDLSLPPIAITIKTMMLKEVNIRPDPNRWRNYDVFKQEFLGHSENARLCKILNPEVVDVSYDAVKRVLAASSDDFMEIENKALGYTVRYLLNSFNKDSEHGTIYYVGSVQFVPMKGAPSQQRRWEKNRMAVYYGSSEHFLRSCIANQIDEQGFKVFRLIRTPNKNRPSDSLITAKLRYFHSKFDRTGEYLADSIRYWNERAGWPKMTEYLVKTPLKVDEFIKPTDQRGVFAISFKDCLYVRYTKKTDMETTMSITKPYVFFDNNGIIINPDSCYDEGYWGTQRIAELLPVDYEPQSSNKKAP